MINIKVNKSTNLEQDEFSIRSATTANVLFEYVRDIIYNNNRANLDFGSLPPEFHDLGKGLNYLQHIIAETKAFANELAKGNLYCETPSRGNEIAAPLKTLHSSLIHLTWQSKQVAIGDYEQKVNFMGEFSDSFNNMINQLKQQRKMNFQENSALKKYVEMMLGSITNPLLVFDNQCKLIFISNSWFNYCHYFHAHEVIGKRIEELFAPIATESIINEILHYYLTACTEKKVMVMENDLNLLDIDIYGHFKVQFTPMIDEQNSVAGMMVFMFDLTESEQARRDAEKARTMAEQSLKIKNNFLAKMSHEIRTPINVIKGITQSELEKEDLAEKSIEAFEKIYESTNDLLDLINDILDLSNIETGKIDLNLKNYNLPNIINDVVRFNNMHIGQKGIELILQVDEKLPNSLYGDDLRIKQVLNKLISNAFKYTEKGYVKISFQKGDDFIPENHLLEKTTDQKSFFLICTIEDTGQGMTVEEQNQLFTEYSNYISKNQRDAQGAGFGLTIVNNIIMLMQGTLALKSDYGKGSTFTLKIPQQICNNELIGNEIASKLQNFCYKYNAHSKLQQIIKYHMPYGKVLVVDDVQTNIYVASKLLSSYQLIIDTALSGFEAIDHINSGKTYDIIFMDYMMPKMDGIETTLQLRNLGYQGTIVALTANALTGNDIMFKENGFDEYMTKPIDVKKLNDILNFFILQKHPEEAIKYKTSIFCNDEPPSLSTSQTHSENEKKDSKLIKIFCRDTQEAIDTMLLALKNNDLSLFTTNAHALKSMLISLGQSNNSKIAADLESAGREKNRIYIEQNIYGFINNLKKIIQELMNDDSALNCTEENEVTHNDMNILEQYIPIIIEACKNFDDITIYNTINLLNQNYIKSQTKNLLEQVYDLIYLHSDFGEAEKLAQRILNI